MQLCNLALQKIWARFSDHDTWVRIQLHLLTSWRSSGRTRSMPLDSVSSEHFKDWKYPSTPDLVMACPSCTDSAVVVVGLAVSTASLDCPFSTSPAFNGGASIMNFKNTIARVVERYPVLSQKRATRSRNRPRSYYQGILLILFHETRKRCWSLPSEKQILQR